MTKGEKFYGCQWQKFEEPRATGRHGFSYQKTGHVVLQVGDLERSTEFIPRFSGAISTDSMTIIETLGKDPDNIQSLETFIRSASRALVIGVGGGGDVVGALAVARFLQFCGLEFLLGGLSWERSVYDPIPGPRKLCETRNVRALHEFAWMANADTQTVTGVHYAESRMAAALAQEVLLLDINGGVTGVINGIETAMHQLQTDLLVGVDVGGDSLAEGHETGLRSPLADSIMLAAFAELERRGRPTMWGVFGRPRLSSSAN